MRKVAMEDAIQWADNKPGDWYYYDVQEATNSHEYVRTDKPIDGQDFCYEEWIKLKENRNWAELSPSGRICSESDIRMIFADI